MTGWDRHLTAGDRQVVHAVLLGYADRLDADDVDGILDCLTPDVHLEFFSGRVVIDGLDRARQMFEETVRSKHNADPAITTMHQLPNVLVEPAAPGRANVRTTGTVYAYSGPGHPLDVRGLAYRQECVLAGDRWLIARLEHESLWQFSVEQAGLHQR